MTDLLDEAAFTVGDTTYTWADTVLSAALRGEWRAVEQRVAAARSAQAIALHEPLPSGEPERSAIAFRYERQLASAQAMEDWLRRWRMTAQEWLEYIRQLVVQRGVDLSGTIAQSTERTHLLAHEMERTCLVNAICSGALEHFARALAERAAAAAAVSAGEHRDMADGAAAARALAMPSLDEYVALPSGLRDRHVRAAELWALERALEQYQRRVATDHAIGECLAAHRIDWISAEYRTVAFGSDAAAREAMLCVRDDGLELAAVAAEARVPLERQHSYLDALAPSLRDAMLAAQPGEFLGPIALDGRWSLYEVVQKRLPSDTDPALRRRAEDIVVARALALETQARVRWRQAGVHEASAA